MSYQAQISRISPTAFLFVVDQSGSMADKMSSGRSKAEFVADALNRTLVNLVTRCSKSEGVRDYFDVGVIGYSGTTVGNGDRKSTRLNSSHSQISYAVFCLKKKKK